jgi:hypothetical protein
MPNWRKIITSGSNASLNSLTTPANVVNSLTASYTINALTASFALDVSSSIYSRELHVSQQSGNDSGSGTLLKPFATITKALATAQSGNQIVIHPGTYTETVTVSGSANNITLTAANSEIGGIVNIAGIFNMNQNTSSVRVVGLTVQGINISGSSSVYLKDSAFTTSGIVKTGGGYLEIDRVSCEYPAPLTVTGAGSVTVTNSKLGVVTVNNASATVNIRGNTLLVTPTCTLGTMLIDGGVVYSLTDTTGAVFSGPNSVVLVKDAMLLTPSSTNARMTLSTGSFVSIQNTTYDKTNSVLGTSLNNTSNFQAINADAITGSFARITSITGSLFGTASWSRNASTASIATTASFTQTGSYLINPSISGSTTGVSTVRYNTLTGSSTAVLPANTVSGEIVTFGSGTGFTPGMVYFLSSSYQWALASCNSETTSTNLLAIATGTTPQQGMLLKGTARFTSIGNYSSGSVGSPMYISTSGSFTNTAPSGVNTVVRVIGHTLSTSDRILYFNPDNYWRVPSSEYSL